MPIGGIIFLTIFIAIFGTVLIFLARAIGGQRKNNSSIKRDIYECGIPGQDKKESKVSVKFYLTAILFILFDIEIIFMYPWAISFKDFIASGMGTPIVVSMALFLGIFIYGLWWEVKSRALEWD
ncbi:MAG: NADH-quinone oxidoreductase subunit A [Bdellovibrionales bacterium]